ncbi:MAG: Nramp family divalent metal transporter, partial [Acidocella sp.]|nr:Nramp family divalent metal transporter [Acidocella sp.]
MMVGLTEQTTADIQAVLAGKKARPGTMLLFAGPAVVVSIAYMDPGNYATNIAAGSAYGYDLLWVVLAASLVAVLFQSLSARLGIVTGKNLAEMCRAQFPRPVVYAMWGISEVAAMATDLAEFTGGAIGLSLLFKLPLLAAMAVTGVVTYGVLLFDRRGFRPIELVIGGLVCLVSLCFLIEIFIAPVAWGQAAYHTFVPVMPGGAALTIAVGIVGATIMPHAVYLHSALTQARAPGRNVAERRVMLRMSNWECMIALG